MYGSDFATGNWEEEFEVYGRLRPVVTLNTSVSLDDSNLDGVYEVNLAQ